MACDVLTVALYDDKIRPQYRYGNERHYRHGSMKLSENTGKRPTWVLTKSALAVNHIAGEKQEEKKANT